jgi:nitrogen fixation/metabolism regulation signal transduction histidine kinase
MMLKKFSVNIIVRILALSATCLLLAFTLKNPNHLFSISFYSILIIIQVVLLINYVNRISKQLSQFYQSVINEDSTISLKGNSGQHETALVNTLNTINSQISQLKYEKEVNFTYLRQVVDHLNTGIIAYSKDGSVDIVNKASLNLLGLDTLNNIYELKSFGENFYRKITNPSITGNDTIEVKKNQSILKFSLRSSMFRLGNQNIQLISLHNIKEELELNEVKSWEKLIRVITHEIMNSVSPVVSLTATIGKIFKKNDTPLDASEIENKHIQDTLKGLNIIKRRGNGLLEFVKKIRQVHLLPEPIKEEIKVNDLFEGVTRLMKHSLEENNISYETNVYPATLTIYADRSLVEQILINLVKNSVEALENNSQKRLELKAFQVNEHKIIEITDNGAGIPQDIMEDIFIPFFSTKKEGSGIGLSLSRQIMRFHNGSIQVRSEPYEQTVFTLKF